ncbi:MAG TPA: DUF2252 domain-containing protein [Acidimicrobiia bacterium]
MVDVSQRDVSQPDVSQPDVGPVAAVTRLGRRGRGELRDFGRSLRERVPLDAHGECPPAERDPVAILQRQAASRIPDLVPLRHARMAASPFTFYRGGAAVMAADLARTTSTGVHVQACGDAHLLNFGLFGSAERRIVFDINDFDETLPGPWEWDLKRLAASVVLAARSLGLDTQLQRGIVAGSVCEYATYLSELAELSTLDVWYADVDAVEVSGDIKNTAMRRSAARAVDKARRRTNLRAFEKLTQVRDGRRVIVDDPPVVEHLADISMTSVLGFLEGYAETLSDDRRRLLSEFELVDAARKVVGVGSVGTRCYVMVGQGRAGLDPLILQVKEAEDSVLAPFIGASEYDHKGRRVVEGQRLMQATSDLFLGWSTGDGYQFYVRQLRDMKGGIEIEGSTPDEFEHYAKLCAATLARAHARSLDPAVIAGYCGKGRKLGSAIARFAEVYADLSERDHAIFLDAIAAGEIPAAVVARND